MIMIAFFREKIGDDNTGKSLSGALLFAEHGENMLCTELFSTFRTISVHNLFYPCSSKRRAPDKDLPVYGGHG